MKPPGARIQWLLLPAAFLAVGGSSCVPPDRPEGLADPISGALSSHLQADTIRTLRFGEGLWYRYLWSPRGPWGIHVVEVDLKECSLGFTLLTAEEVTDRRRSFAELSRMARAAGALAAVNGDFFLREGIPRGPEVRRGTVRRARTQAVFAWSPRTGPRIGLSRRLEGGGLGLHGSASDRFPEMLGGLPQLLHDGQPVHDTTPAESFRNGRHPRTAVGIDAEGHRLWLVVVDGRQEYSAGMTLGELRELFEFLGARDALNLDGGGSSTMVVAGRVMNRPSDVDGERAVVNGLGVLRDPSLCPWLPGTARAVP